MLDAVLTSPLVFLSTHLEDLQRSGLSEATIAAAGIYNVDISTLRQLFRHPIPDDTTAYAIPYSHANGHVRVRFFPPLTDEDGRSIKYLQPTGSPVRAYFPPGIEGLLTNANVTLHITEGEKKSLALQQVGLSSIGLGGAWGFRDKDHALVEDLEQIAWKGRIVYLDPDSDAWRNDQVLLGFFTLGRELEQRGAVVSMLRLPDLPGVEKTGVDEFLVANGVAAFVRLCSKALTLQHPVFHSFRRREKRQQLERASSQDQTPQELQGRLIHPALHFEADWASVGVYRLKGSTPEMCLVTSQRHAYPTQEALGVLSPLPQMYPDLIGRWPEERLEQFLAGESVGSLAEMAVLIHSAAHTLLELKRPQEYALVTAWVVATYVYPMFAAFPRLSVVGEKGSGKSKLQSFLASVCFNGLLRLNPTPAILFRLASALRPTFCLDEVEGLSTEDRREVLAVVNAGYKAGAYVDRVEGDDRQVRSFAVYTPMSLAAIQELNAVTEDRAIVIVMERGQDSKRLNQEIETVNSVWGKVRAMGFEFALTRFADVQAAYDGVALPGWLVGRERELWKPLLAIAGLVDRENNLLHLSDDLQLLAREQAEERSGFAPDTEALIDALEERLELEHELSVRVRPGDLCQALQKSLNRERIASQSVGAMLRRLRFKQAGRGRTGKGVGSLYVVTRERIDQLKTLYIPAEIATLQQSNVATVVTDCHSSSSPSL